MDDDATVRDSLSNVFVAEGYSVIPAANGQQALDLANRLPADLVLLDLNMPVMISGLSDTTDSTPPVLTAFRLLS